MLERLIGLYGPSSRENSVKEFIEKELETVCEVSRDNIGNVIAHIPGNGKKVLLAAHMDEIGVMVTFIDDKGFLRFAPVGGLSVASLPFARVKFPGGIIGVIAYPEKTELKDLKISDMYIDIGACSKEEAEKLVGIGDMAEFVSSFHINGDTVMSGKLDDRAGCHILLNLAKKVKNPSCDLFLAFTVQEEVGLKGAGPAVFGTTPYMAIAVDVTDTGDTPDSEPMAVSLGKGAAIKVKDGRMVASPEVRDLLEKTCRENNIPYQLEILTGGTTDAAVMQVTAGGVLTGAVSVPTRYIHTTSETASLKDIDAVEALLEKLLERDELK